MAGRVPPPWKGRCWHVAGGWRGALRRLSESLGPSESRTATSTPRASLASAGALGDEALVAEGSADAPSSGKEPADAGRPAPKSKEPKESKKSKEAGGLNWDDIPEYDIDEEDALDKVVNFAAGVYTRAAQAVETIQPDSQSGEEDNESEHSEAGEGNHSEVGGEGDSQSSSEQLRS